MARTDVGARAVQAIRERLMVDDEWSVDLPHGFAWWADDLRQEITAEPPVGTSNQERARVVVRTEIARDLLASASSLATITARINSQPIGGAVRSRPDRSLVLESTFPAVEDTLAWIVHTATTVSTLALTSGRALVEEHLGELGGSLASSTHPTSGRRPIPDDMLNLPAQFPLFAAQQERQHGPTSWSQPAAWKQAADIVNSIGLGFSTTGGPALTAEFPLRTLTHGEAPTMALSPGVPTALLRGEWTPETPLGPGILLRLFLPFPGFTGFDGMADVAAALNRAEIERGGNPESGWPAHFGAWTVLASLNREQLVAYSVWGRQCSRPASRCPTWWSIRGFGHEMLQDGSRQSALSERPSLRNQRTGGPFAWSRRTGMTRSARRSGLTPPNAGLCEPGQRARSGPTSGRTLRTHLIHARTNAVQDQMELSSYGLPDTDHDCRSGGGNPLQEVPAAGDSARVRLEREAD